MYTNICLNLCDPEGSCPDRVCEVYCVGWCEYTTSALIYVVHKDLVQLQYVKYSISGYVRPHCPVQYTVFPGP